MRAEIERKLFKSVRVGEDMVVKKTPIIIDHTLSFAAECASAKEKGAQHRVEFGFTADGGLAYARCDCLTVTDPAMVLMNQTIEALGGALCKVRLNKELKKFRTAVASSKYVVADATPAGWFGQYTPAIQRGDTHRALRKESRPLVQPTENARWEMLISAQMSAKAKLPLRCFRYDHKTGLLCLALARIPLVERASRTAPFTAIYGTSNSSSWLDNDRCLACNATYHGAYLKRHLKTPLHEKTVRTLSANLLKLLARGE